MRHVLCYYRYGYAICGHRFELINSTAEKDSCLDFHKILLNDGDPCQECYEVFGKYLADLRDLSQEELDAMAYASRDEYYEEA